MLWPAISVFTSSGTRNLACFYADGTLGKYNLLKTSLVQVPLLYYSYLINILKLLLVLILLKVLLVLGNCMQVYSVGAFALLSNRRPADIVQFWPTCIGKTAALPLLCCYLTVVSLIFKCMRIIQIGHSIYYL